MISITKNHYQFLSILLVLYILHSILAIIPPINSDEALYWEHSRHLALGYYSHPPLTGWIIAIITNFFGISKYSIRLASILLHLGTIVVVYLLAFEISKSKIFSNISIIIYSLFPLSIFFGTVITSDCSLFLFFSLTTFFLHKAVINDRKQFWYYGGISAGGMMLSKFMAFLFFPGVFFFLLFIPKYRNQLLTVHPYFAFCLTLLIFSPFIYWNAQNDWLTFQFNFLVRNQNLELDWKNPFLFFIGQMLAFSPLIFFSIVLILKNNLITLTKKLNEIVHKKNIEDSILFLSYIAGFPLIFFLIISIKVQVGAHWAGVVLPIASILLTISLFPEYSYTNHSSLDKKKLYGWLISASIVVLPMLILIIQPKILPNHLIYIDKVGSPTKPGSHIFGWKEIGRHLQNLIFKYDNQSNGLFLAAKDYGLASTIAFNVPSHPDVFLINYPQRGKHGKEYLIWGKGQKKIGNNMIYVTDNHDEEIDEIKPFFQDIKKLPPLVVKDDHRILRVFYIYLGKHYLGGEQDHLSIW